MTKDRLEQDAHQTVIVYQPVPTFSEMGRKERVASAKERETGFGTNNVIESNSSEYTVLT